MVAKENISPGKKLHASDPFKALEKELNKVVNCCESLVNDESKDPGTKNKVKRKRPKYKELDLKNASTITLEQIAANISDVLGNFKNNLSAFKQKRDSFSDVVPQLEQLFMESNGIAESNPKPRPKIAVIDQIKNDKKPSADTRSDKKQSQNTNITEKTIKPVEPNITNNNKKQIKNYSAQDVSVASKNVKDVPQRPKTVNNTTGRKLSVKQGSENQKSKNSSSCSVDKKTVPQSNSKATNKIVKKASVAQQNVPAVSNKLPPKPKPPQHSTKQQAPNQNKQPLNIIPKPTQQGQANLKDNQSVIPHRSNLSTVPPKVSSNITPKSQQQTTTKFSHGCVNAKKQSSTKLLSQTALNRRSSNQLRLHHVNISRDVYDPLGVLREQVAKAIRERKTFTIRGNFAAIRRALMRRGWIEKIHLSYRDRINEELKRFQTYKITDLVELTKHKDIGEVCKKLIKSKLLTDHQVDLYWSFNTESFKECPINIKRTKFNKFRWDAFTYTSKQGLCQAAKISHWFQIPGIAKLNHPRTYSLVKNGDTDEFIRDFHRTAAMSLMKWVQHVSSSKMQKLISPTGKIPLRYFDFSVNECYKIIKRAKHEDIDSEIKERTHLEWSEFLENFYKIVHVGNHFKETQGVQEIDLVRKATYVIGKLKSCWPYLEMDGMMNIWILKPTNSSQGWGIHMCRTLKYVLDVVKANPKRRYIIQKYIERPLLIYNTKFDIRQWFLISKAVPLTIWIYKDCYLRFSSQTYNLRKLHESIHLTNNSVQCRYAKCNSRDISLPSYNMWDSKQFITYLSDIGFPKAFSDIIYPGMKENITAAVLLHQEKIDQRYNCFELYGADFILTEDFKPWLLEINSNPALHASTPITGRMCPTVLEDVIKVVIDYEHNKNAHTGRFELLYQGKITSVKCKGIQQVSGIPLTPEYFHNSSKTSQKSSNDEMQMVKSNSIPEAAKSIKELGQGMKQTLEDLMELLKNEKLRRQNQMNRSIIAVLDKNNIDTQTQEFEIGSIELNEIPDASRDSEELLVHQISDETIPGLLINKVKGNNKKQKNSVISILKKITKIK